MAELASWNDTPVKPYHAFIVSLDFAETAKRLPADGTLKTVSMHSVTPHTSFSEDQLRLLFDALPSASARMRYMIPFEGWKRRCPGPCSW